MFTRLLQPFILNARVIAGDRRSEAHSTLIVTFAHRVLLSDATLSQQPGCLKQADDVTQPRLMCQGGRSQT